MEPTLLFWAWGSSYDTPSAPLSVPLVLHCVLLSNSTCPHGWPQVSSIWSLPWSQQAPMPSPCSCVLPHVWPCMWQPPSHRVVMVSILELPTELRVRLALRWSLFPWEFLAWCFWHKCSPSHNKNHRGEGQMEGINVMVGSRQEVAQCTVRGTDTTQFKFYLEISNLEKYCSYNLKNSCTCFTLIYQLLIFCLICFIIFSLYVIFLNHLRISCRNHATCHTCQCVFTKNKDILLHSHITLIKIRKFNVDIGLIYTFIKFLQLTQYLLYLFFFWFRSQSMILY